MQSSLSGTGEIALAAQSTPDWMEPREFVQGVVPSPRSGAVQALGLTFVAVALRSGDLLLDVSIVMARLKLCPVARGYDILQAQIEPHRLF